MSKNISSNIKEARVARGLNQTQLASLLGMSVSGYNKIERGDTEVSLGKVEEIAAALEIPFEELIRKRAAKVITFANQKGGVGKSTMLTLFATSMAKRLNMKTLIIDCDYQQSITDIAEKAGTDENISILTFDINRSDAPVLDFIKIIEREKYAYDLIAVDTAGSLQQSDFIITTLAYSDAAILPLEATSVALSSSLATIAVLPNIEERRKKEGKGFVALGVINKDGNTLESKDLKAIKNFHNIKLMKNTLKQRVRYHRDLSFAEEIVTAKEKDEYNELFEEIIEGLQFQV